MDVWEKSLSTAGILDLSGWFGLSGLGKNERGG
jgi:hypothetical protein